jgi:D-threo-aldose 1-dehydrogenase
MEASMNQDTLIGLGPLGLGTAPIGGLYEAIGDETAHAVVDRAWGLGLRYFDTAPLYGAGLAERRLGAVLRGKPRDEYWISTKVGRLLRPGRSVWHEAPDLVDYFDFSHDAALRSLEESLERLGLDRVDIAFVHDPEDHLDEALAGAFRALRRLRDEGVVRAIGVGANYTEVHCRFAREVDPDCFLVAGRYTVLDRSATHELLPLCEQHRIAVIAGGVFNSGVLAGGDTFNYEPAPQEVVARVDELRERCARHGVPLPAAAVQFPLRHPVVITALMGCSTPDEVAEDVRLANLDVPEALWTELG